MKAYIECLASASNLNAFLHKIETAIQGTLTGVFFPPEDEVQVHLNLIRILHMFVLEVFHRYRMKPILGLREQSKATGPSDQDVKSSQ